jgi:hypothetical protein
MELEEALTAYLLAQSGLTALIGNNFKWDERPAGTPMVVGINISDVKDHLLSGQSDLEHPYIQFTAYANTRAEARAVGNQLKAALADFSGTLSGIQIQQIELQNELSSSETIAEVGRVFTHDQEYQIFFIKE